MSNKQNRLYQDVIREVENAPAGPQIAAIFDFDGTIINGFSALIHIREQVKAGHIKLDEFLKLSRGMLSFGFGQIDFSSMMTLSAQFLEGRTDQELETFSETVYLKYIAKRIYPESRALIEAHLRKGHTVALISSATQYQVDPAAKDLGIEHAFSSQLEVKDGTVTGKLASSCYGQGKVRAAKQLFENQDIDTEASFFYSDGEEDIPLLDLVGHPRPLNPSKKLQEFATKRNWPIQNFDSRGVPSMERLVRSVGAYYAVLSSVSASLPILALSGSRRHARNFSLSLFADTASALIGLDIKVNNEHRLWSHRPAVFIFNHQSKTDVLLVTRLLRRDVVGIGKKEIRNIPLIGKALEYAGMVMIDRSNNKSAIQAMKPLIEIMQNEGQSVAIAPEGTRTVSKKLAPFKKGAFHIAMQAGVPIVPIVIHNALDSAPKGQFVFNPCTVEVDILEPIATDAWEVENIDEHIESVRRLYKEKLSEATTQTPRKNKKASTQKRTSAKTKTKVKAKAEKSIAKKRSSAPKKAAQSNRSKNSGNQKTKGLAENASSVKVDTGKAKKTVAKERVVFTPPDMTSLGIEPH